MVSTETLRAHIHNKAAESLIRSTALDNGMQLMREDGQRLVLAGITSQEELTRVTRESN
jgi:general secretion pathway protein E